MKQETSPLLQIFVLICFAVGIEFAISIAALALSIFGVDITSTSFLLATQAIGGAALFVVPVVLLAVLYGHDYKTMWQLDFSAPKWKLALVSAIIMVAFSPLNDVITSFNDSWHFGGVWAKFEEYFRTMADLSNNLIEKFLATESVWGLIVNLLVIAVLPAICEELFFRGCMQQLMTKWLRNPHWAIVITAAIFSIAHGDIFAFLTRFAMGIVLGYLFYASGSILVSASAHFVNNALVVLFGFLSARGVIDYSALDTYTLPWWVVVLATLSALLLFGGYMGEKIVRKPSLKP
ncbi:MAG: CPBP family intramembrane metalloprotease [Bacteroidales bacterium]|nr:CPBP family intramembrane metalloprotease [Bacteroidales bacterium]